MTKSESTKIGDSVPDKAARETLTALYNPLTHAAVQTRRDTDRITFRYIATFVAIITVLASDHLTLNELSTQVGATIVVIFILIIAIATLWKRVEIYSLLFENLVRIESALGAFSPSALEFYDPADNLKENAFFPAAWSERKLELAKRQHRAHEIGLTSIAIITIATVWAF